MMNGNVKLFRQGQIVPRYLDIQERGVLPYSVIIPIVQ